MRWKWPNCMVWEGNENDLIVWSEMGMTWLCFELRMTRLHGLEISHDQIACIYKDESWQFWECTHDVYTMVSCRGGEGRDPVEGPRLIPDTFASVEFLWKKGQYLTHLRVLNFCDKRVDTWRICECWISVTNPEPFQCDSKPVQLLSAGVWYNYDCHLMTSGVIVRRHNFVIKSKSGDSEDILLSPFAYYIYIYTVQNHLCHLLLSFVGCFQLLV